jgi:hypothetical protein
MADDIRQIVSIEAAQALRTLRDLDVGLRKFSQSLADAGGAMRQFNNLAGKLDGNASGIRDALRQTTRSFTTFDSEATVALRNIDRNTTRLTTSLGLLSRVVFTQAIVRGLNEIRTGLRDTIDETKEFQRQVALAQTIGGGASFGQIAGASRDISARLGINQNEVAAGIGQALSNQIGDFTQSAQFTEIAGQFAKATGSTLPESVNLLSSAIKSFNLTAADTTKVADKFFVAIDKGRLTASGLANSLGRVLPIAGELGISLDEVNGFLAAASITGANESEVITQLRGAMSSFVKPSDAMKDALQKLGFESGRAATQQLGLQGAIDAVRKTAIAAGPDLKELFPGVTNFQGAEALRAFEQPSEELAKRLKALGFESGKAAVRQLGLQGAIKAVTTNTKDEIAALGELFPNVRALTGVVAGLNTQVEHYNATVAESSNATNKLSNALKIVESTDADKLEKSLNRISIAFSENFGDRFIRGSAKTLDFLGEFGNAINRIGSPLGGGLNSNAFTKAVQEENERQKGLLDARIQQAIDADNKLVEQATKTAERLRALGQTNVSQQLTAIAQSQGGAGQRAATDEVTREKLAKDIAAFQLIAADIAKTQSLSEFGRLKPLTDEITKLTSGQIDPSRLALVVEQVRQLTANLPNNNSTQQLQIAVAALNNAAIAQAKLTNAENLNTLIGATAQTGSNLAAATADAARLADQLERAAKASQQIGGGSVLGNGQSVSKLATGGFAPRGTDTIPAMLSPGEFVINAASSKRFFSELVSINAGREPVYRAESGSVTINNNIGDVSFHGVKDGEIAVRQFASRLAREQRRGGIR